MTEYVLSAEAKFQFSHSDHLRDHSCRGRDALKVYLQSRGPTFWPVKGQTSSKVRSSYHAVVYPESE